MGGSGGRGEGGGGEGGKEGERNRLLSIYRLIFDLLTTVGKKN